MVQIFSLGCDSCKYVRFIQEQYLMTLMWNTSDSDSYIYRWFENVTIVEILEIHRIWNNSDLMTIDITDVYMLQKRNFSAIVVIGEDT